MTNNSKKEQQKNLPELEGQLTVDVYQTEKELVIQSAIAGVKIEDLNISIEGDKVIIRGKRERPPEINERNYFYAHTLGKIFQVMSKRTCWADMIIGECHKNYKAHQCKL